MAIIKHTEYKIICDNCGSDVTEWTPARNQRTALNIWSQQIGVHWQNNHYCEPCMSGDIDVRKKKIDVGAAIEVWKKSKPTPIDELLK